MLWLAVAAHAVDLEDFPPPRDCTTGWRSVIRPTIVGGTSITSAVRPLRVWFDPDHPNSAAIAPAVLEQLELAWDVQVDQLGFREPVLPDAAEGPELDVYLLDYQPFAAFVIADSYMTDPLYGDGYNSASSYMVIDRGLPLNAVPSYVAHEFNHVLQYATDWSEPTLPIWEGCATAAQKWTVAELGRWDSEVDSFQEAPWYPALTGDSYTIWYESGLGYNYEYGAALWVMWLDERFYDGAGAGGVALWEAAANEGLSQEPDAVDAFAAVVGLPLPEALNEMAFARIFTGDDWAEGGLVDAAAWGPARAVPKTALTLPVAAQAADPAPMITGSVYYSLDLAAVEPGTLTIAAESASGLVTGVAVAVWDASGAVTTHRAVGAMAEVQIPVTGALDRAVIGVTNAGPPGWDGDDEAYVPGDQRLSASWAAPDPGTTDTTPTPPTPSDPDAKKGCGCDSSAPSAWPLLALLVLAGRRRTVRGTAPNPSY